MNTRLKAIVLALSLGLTAEAAQATILNFDSLNPALMPIPNGYGGLNWTNFGTTDSTQSAYTNSGYANGMISANNVAFNFYGSNASFSSSSTFSLNSAYFSGAWNDGLQITVTAYLAGNQVDTTTFSVNTTGPILETFNWINIDTVNFSAVGGTPHAGLHGGGTHFVMDNLTINAVPEPNDMALLALGLGLMAFIAKRHSKAA